MKDIVLLDLIKFWKRASFDLFIYGIPNHGRLKSYGAQAALVEALEEADVVAVGDPLRSPSCREEWWEQQPYRDGSLFCFSDFSRLYSLPKELLAFAGLLFHCRSWHPMRWCNQDGWTAEWFSVLCRQCWWCGVVDILHRANWFILPARGASHIKQYNITQHNTTQRNTAQYNTMIYVILQFIRYKTLKFTIIRFTLN